MSSSASTLKAFTDAAADAVAREIASIRREAQRERDLREAEHRARMAELETRLISAADIERKLAERLAELKDGEPGPQGEPGPPGEVDGEVLREVVGQAVAALPPAKDGEPGRDGTDADMVAVAAQIAERVAEAVAALPPPERGERGEPGQDADVDAIKRLIAEEVVTAVSTLPPAEKGDPGQDGRDGYDPEVEVTQDGADVEFKFTVGDIRYVYEVELPTGPEGATGKDGEPGRDGAPGKMELVAPWEERIHYDGAIRTHLGGTWQALRDTAHAPPHEDWTCLAAPGAAGQDGQSFNPRGLYAADGEYKRLDVVALNGGSFVATSDEPGPCPGDGWKLLASAGKRGEKGERGERGERGLAGPHVVAAAFDEQGLLTLVNADGSKVECDMYPVLARIAFSRPS